MTENEIRDKLINNQNLSIQDKIDIFNWWLREKSSAIVVIFPEHPEISGIWLHKQQISTVKNPQILEYSIMKIKEDLGLINKSRVDINEFLLGFR